MPTNSGPTTDSDASTPRRLPGETHASTLDQGLLAELDYRSQLPKQEAEETHPATSDPSEVLVQVGSNQGGDDTFLDHERLNNNASFQVDPMVTTTARNDNNNKATDYSPRAGVTGDYSSMARNERIMSYPMLDLTQSRHKQQILQDPSTAPLVSPSLAQATVKLVPLSSSSSHLLAHRQDAAVAATTKASLGSGNPPTSSGALPRPGTPFSTDGTAPRLGANAAHEPDSYFPMVSVRASLGLTGTGDLSTPAPAPPPMPTRYLHPPSWYLNLPLRLAQLLRPDFFPQRAYWSDYAYRRRRASLLSCALFAEEEEEDQEQVLPSSSDEVKDEDGSEFETDSEASVIDDQSLALFPVLSHLEADDVASRRAVERLDLSNGSELLGVVESMEGPGSAISLTDVAQGSTKDNSSNGTPASHSISEEWPPAEMRNLTVNFLFDIQPTSPLTDAFPLLNPQADGFPTVVNDGLEPETAAAPLDQNLQALLDFLNTPAQSPLSLPLVIQEVENAMESIDATLPAHESECHQSNLTKVEGEEANEERGSQSVRPWMKHKTIRADLDLLKFTADYSVAVKVRDDFVETSSRLREQQLRHFIYMRQAFDWDVRKEEKQDKEKEKKLEKEEEGGRPVGDCEDLLEDLTVSSLAQPWLDDDSETVTPGSRMGGSGSSTPVIAAGEEIGIKKEGKDEFAAKLDVVFSQLGGLLVPPRLARKERLLQGDFAHEDSHEHVHEVAGKSSLIDESLSFVVDDETGDSHESLVLGCESAYDSDDGEDEDAFVDALEEGYSQQHPYVTHILFHSHPHLRDLYPPEIPQTIPKRPSYILDEQGQIQILAPDAPLPDLSTWTFQPGPHHTPVVNNKVVVTCENCLGQFDISPDNLDVLERHQAESCRTPLQQKWQRFLLVTEKMTGRGKLWDIVRRRSRRGVYRLSNRTINWMMDALLGQLQLVQALVDEDAFDADAGRLVEKEEEEEVVREVIQGSGYWWPALPTEDGYRE